jgi:photosystem II stability/assembly factor-like uncharacterized protein
MAPPRTARSFPRLAYLLLALLFVALPGRAQQQRLRRGPDTQELLAREHLDRQGRLRPDLWQQGIQHSQQMAVAAGGPAGAGATALAASAWGRQWNQIGPSPLLIDPPPPDINALFQGVGPDSGQVVGIAIDPRGPTDRIVYIATNGGVWKSTDGGASWQPKTDFLPSPSIGCVTVDPVNSNIVYAGTGNPQHLSYSGFLLPGYWFVKGVGIYKSLDGGDSWTVLGSRLFSGLTMAKILVARPNTLLAATSGGLFRSINGGLNFGSNPPRFNNGLPILDGSVTDLAVDTADPTVVYAAVGNVGLLKSMDGGITFPVNLFDSPGGPPLPFPYISFAQSALPDNRTIYASLGDRTTTPRFRGLFKTSDGGASWARMPGGDAACMDPDLGGGQCSAAYTQTVGVDPRDADRVYIGFEQLWLSTDGGMTVANVSRYQIHWDHHALVFSPRGHQPPGAGPSAFWATTDGGVHRSADGGVTFANLNDGIATNLFIGIGMSYRNGSQFDARFTYGGTQDCGTIEHRPDHVGAQWHLSQDCDGLNTVVDPFNPLQAYGLANYTNFLHTTDGGNSWSFPNNPPGLPCNGKLFTLAVDPNDSARVYVGEDILGGTVLYGSTDTAASFQTFHSFPAGIASIGMSRADSNVMWVGLENGEVWRTANIDQGPNATWIDTGAPAGSNPADVWAFNHVAADTDDPAVACAVFKGFTDINPVNPTQHAFLTVDNGATWRDISGTRGNRAGNLPDLPVNDVLFDPTTGPHAIIVATDAAVMRTGDRGRTWQVLGLGLPTISCRSLAIHAGVSPPVLRIGTYGRSCWQLGISRGRLSVAPGSLYFGVLSPGGLQPAVRSFTVRNGGDGLLAVRVLAPDAPYFLLVGEGAFTLLPQESRTVRVGFWPDRAGVFQSAVRILSGSSQTPSFDVRLLGIGGRVVR